MTEQLNAFAVCHNTCFRRTRQVSNLLKSPSSNKNNENNNNNINDNNYYYSNKITIKRCGLDVFFGGLRQNSAYFGHWVISVFLVTIDQLTKHTPVYPLLSSHVFFFLPLLLFLFTVSCSIAFAKPEDLETQPNHLSFRFLTTV